MCGGEKENDLRIPAIASRDAPVSEEEAEPVFAFFSQGVKNGMINFAPGRSSGLRLDSVFTDDVGNRRWRQIGQSCSFSSRLSCVQSVENDAFLFFAVFSDHASELARPKYDVKPVFSNVHDCEVT